MSDWASFSIRKQLEFADSRQNSRTFTNSSSIGVSSSFNVSLDSSSRLYLLYSPAAALTSSSPILGPRGPSSRLRATAVTRHSKRGQSGSERTPHRTSLSSWCARPLLPPSVVGCDNSGLLESVPQSAGAFPAAEPRGMTLRPEIELINGIHGAELHVHHLWP